MRLGDLDALFVKFWGQGNTFDERPKVHPSIVWSVAATLTREAPTIDPEGLPVVRQLRKELARVTAERDAAVKDLKKWNVCATCENYRPKSRTSNRKIKKAYLSGGNWAGCSRWEWHGPQKEE